MDMILFTYMYVSCIFGLCSKMIVFVVPQVGFEPTRPKAEDFESTKSTSSITAAYVQIHEKM